MGIEIIRDTLAWCTVINFGLLLWWVWFFILAHDWTYQLHTRWFRLTVEEFDTVNYTGMALFKIFILLFNLVPYLALRLVGWTHGF